MFSLRKEQKINKAMDNISKILGLDINIVINNRSLIIKDTKLIVDDLVLNTDESFNEAKAINYRIHLIDRVLNVTIPELQRIKNEFQKILDSAKDNRSKFKKDILISVKQINKDLGINSIVFNNIYKQLHLTFKDKVSLFISNTLN